MTEKSITQRLIDGAWKEGGITLPLKIGSIPEKGYVIGMNNLYIGTMTLENYDVKDINNKVIDYINNNYCDAIGSWYNPDTKLLYIDVVAIYNDLDISLQVARERKQLSIYSLANKKVINL